MSKSYIELYVHLVWKTKKARRILSDELELFVHERLRDIGRNLDLVPLAVDSAWDHVHALYRWRPDRTVADSVRRMKSKTAVEWNRPIRNGERDGPLIEWQTGYGAIGIRRSDVERVQTYIDHQKQRHRRDETWHPFEATRSS